MEYFSLFTGNYVTRKRGYKIRWISSSEKRKRDRVSRDDRLRKAEEELVKLNAKIDKRNLKTKEDIEAGARKVLEKREVDRFFHLQIGTAREGHEIQNAHQHYLYAGLDKKYKSVEGRSKHRWSVPPIMYGQEASSQGSVAGL